MAFSNDNSCQICKRSITKEQWNRDLHSSRHTHREENGYWPAHFPQTKLNGCEGSRLEEAF